MQATLTIERREEYVSEASISPGSNFMLRQQVEMRSGDAAQSCADPWRTPEQINLVSCGRLFASLRPYLCPSVCSRGLRAQF